MKKSLRQLLLVGLSAVMLVSVASPAIYAQEDDAEDQTEQVEETEETTEEPAEEESAEEETEQTDTEASEVQAGVEEALSLFEDEYPESEIEEIDVELDQEENNYTILVQGFDAANNTFELEVQWADKAVTEHEFREGWFNTDEAVTEDASEIEEELSEEVSLPLDDEENDEAEMEDQNSEDGEGVQAPDFEADPDQAEAPEAVDPEEEIIEEVETEDGAEGELDEDQAYRALDFENLVSIDEASETALAEVGSGEITHWNLSADTTEWWNFFGDEENENPVWTLEIENTDDDSTVEVRVDAVTGEILNPEDVENASDEEVEETEPTEESVEDASVEEAEETEDAE